MSEEVLTIYTIGYRQANAAEQIENLVAQGYRLIDIRQRAGSCHKPAYNLRQLCQRFGIIYHRLRELAGVSPEPGCGSPARSAPRSSRDSSPREWYVDRGSCADNLIL